MPYVTEELWQHLPKPVGQDVPEALMIAPLPGTRPSLELR